VFLFKTLIKQFNSYVFIELNNYATPLSTFLISN